MRYRITVRGRGTELRGYFDGEHRELEEFSDVMAPFGVVVASHADADYDPFKEEQYRELHHFETEQMFQKARAILARDAVGGESIQELRRLLLGEVREREER